MAACACPETGGGELGANITEELSRLISGHIYVRLKSATGLAHGTILEYES